jgi:hypothetical protein
MLAYLHCVGTTSTEVTAAVLSTRELVNLHLVLATLKYAGSSVRQVYFNSSHAIGCSINADTG